MPTSKVEEWLLCESGESRAQSDYGLVSMPRVFRIFALTDSLPHDFPAMVLFVLSEIIRAQGCCLDLPDAIFNHTSIHFQYLRQGRLYTGNVTQKTDG